MVQTSAFLTVVTSPGCQGDAVETMIKRRSIHYHMGDPVDVSDYLLADKNNQNH